MGTERTATVLKFALCIHEFPGTRNFNQTLVSIPCRKKRNKGKYHVYGKNQYDTAYYKIQFFIIKYRTKSNCFPE